MCGGYPRVRSSTARTISQGSSLLGTISSPFRTISERSSPELTIAGEHTHSGLDAADVRAHGHLNAAAREYPAAMKRIAFLGLGRMGAAMASRLLARGYGLTVYNRTRSRAEPLVQHALEQRS